MENATLEVDYLIMGQDIMIGSGMHDKQASLVLLSSHLRNACFVSILFMVIYLEHFKNVYYLIINIKKKKSYFPLSPKK